MAKRGRRPKLPAVKILEGNPGIWLSDRRNRRKVIHLLDTMNSVYTEIGGGSVVSAKHIRERLTSTTDKGVIWPSEVFPLLDDIIARKESI
jgi:hypothetical protein